MNLEVVRFGANFDRNKFKEKKVYKRKYKIQKIDGLPEKKVTPPKEVYERIKRENQIIGKARSINSNLTFFKNIFIVFIIYTNKSFTERRYLHHKFYKMIF